MAEVLLLSEVAMNGADHDTWKADVYADLLPFLGGCVQLFERGVAVAKLTDESRCVLQALQDRASRQQEHLGFALVSYLEYSYDSNWANVRERAEKMRAGSVGGKCSKV